MASTSKTQLLNEAYTLLKRRYKIGPRPERMSVLEAVVFGICHEGTTRQQANQALSRFKDEFFDWNEVRVSSIREIQGVLADLPDPESRAQRIRKFLRQLFSKTYRFDALDQLAKKPLKEAVKVLQGYEAMQSDYVLATVVQNSLGAHAIPIDAPMRRGLERLGVADSSTDHLALRATVERAIPKNRGAEFADLMEELTHDTCVEGIPDCPRCELKKICPTGQQRLAADKAAEREAVAAARTAARAAAKEAKAREKAAAKTAPAPKEKPPTSKPTAPAARGSATPAAPKAAKPPAASKKAPSKDGSPSGKTLPKPKSPRKK